ncbi:hypothetical protein LEP1GSC170_1773 [Leptospira interrogans serovar Bataviae str. HAI135]|nr:hypothetical protein LEP1GSC170_1773 [Leptospira interrogans serovar Bataviae str. HAI135]
MEKVDSKKSAYFLPVAIFLAMLPVTMIVPVFKEIVKDRFQSGNGEVAWFLSIAMLGSFVFLLWLVFFRILLGLAKKLSYFFAG